MKTAPKYQPFVSGLRERFRQRNEMLEKERFDLLDRIRPAGPALRMLGASEVILFGSILRKGAFDRASDIDILVIGLPDNRVWEALGAAERAAAISERAIDIVFAQMAPGELVANARRSGIRL